MPSELFEKKLREKLSNAVISPSPELWNNIEVQLNGGGPKRRIGFWILLAALLLGSLGALWGFWNMGSEQLAPTAQLVKPMESSPPPVNMNSPVSESAKIPAKENIAEAGLITSHEENTNNTQSIKPTKEEATSPNNKQISANTSRTYKTSVLAAHLSEINEHQVPQHTNQAPQEPHIPSATSSISSSEEIGGETDPISYNSSYLNKKAYELQASPFAKISAAAVPLSENFRNNWSYTITLDMHQDVANISIPIIGPKSDELLSTNDNLNIDASDGGTYSYNGLNSPGNIQVQAPQKSISIGFAAIRHLTHRLSIQAGLEYGRFSTGNYSVGIISSSFSSPSPTETRSSLLSSRSTLFAYHQLGVPLQVNYKFHARNRSSLEVYGGASAYIAQAYSKSTVQSANFYDFTESADMIEQAVSTRNAVSNDVPQLIQYNPLNLSLQGGVNYFYHFSDARSLFIGPQIKFQATPVYKEQISEINEVPYYFGLRLGFRFSR